MRILGDSNSCNCLKVKYTADYLGLGYEWVTVDITRGENRSPEILRINPRLAIYIRTFPNIVYDV